MDGYSAVQIRAAEAPLLAQGVPLMTRAAHALAGQTLAELLRSGNFAHPILVLVGSGNNGGDALYAAAELCGHGIEVRLLPIGTRLHPEGLAAALDAGAKLVTGPEAAEAEAVAEVRRQVGEVRLVMDGILGTGSAGRADLRGKALAVVKELVTWKDRFTVVAVDLPSGLDPDTGVAIDGAVLPADITVTFGACKAGLLQGVGPVLAGRVDVVDIGLFPLLRGVEPLIRSGG